MGKECGYYLKAQRKVNHSVNNAIILLVLAIRKLYKYDKFLSDTDLASTPSPGFAKQRSERTTSRSSPVEYGKEILNIDVYPGLAYYTEASQILGPLIGGRGISYAHAYILAALYMG